MPFPLLAAGAILGGIGSLIGAGAQKKAANAQKSIADQQKNLYASTLPYYQQALAGLANNAGLGQPPAAQPGSNLYTNVSNSALGPYNNPTDRLRLLNAEEGIGQQLRARQHQLATAIGRRGLTDSNIGIAAQAGLANQALQQQGQFARNLAINQGQEQERRIQLLLNALNPGLGSGPAASSAYGQIGAQAGATAGNIAANLGGAAQNYAMLQALQGQNNAGGSFSLGNNGSAQLNNLVNTGLPNYATPGISFGNPTAAAGFTPNPNYNGIGMGNYPGAPQPPALPGQPGFQLFDEFGQA